MVCKNVWKGDFGIYLRKYFDTKFYVTPMKQLVGVGKKNLARGAIF